MKELYTEDSINKLSASLSGYGTHNNRIQKFTVILNKLAPALLSSLFTIYSSISSSFLVGFSPLLYYSSFLFGEAFVLGIVFYLISRFFSKMWRIIGVEVWRKFGNDDSGLYVIDSYKPIYEKNMKKSIKSAFTEISEFAFVIIFPGSIYDILIGVTENSPNIAINGINQIELGVTLLVFSILFLIMNVRNHLKVTKQKVNKNREEMRSYLRQIIDTLEKSPHFRVLFDSDLESMD